MTNNYEKYILNNGLNVVLHENHSSPVVAVAILYHVGSNREIKGKTGFAHFFEHMLFQRSEHLKRNEFFNKINDLGGNFNGGTWEDGTVYYESVPNDSLEKILWMESDRMGFFINTISLKGLKREIDVVINEKRQVIDNKPYGYTNTVLSKYMYPEDHPYSRVVIGDPDDLKSSSVDDVKDFYLKYYAPDNATLVISGDFDRENTIGLIDKYFGEISRKSSFEKSRVLPTSSIKETRHLYYEDKLISMPELNIAFTGCKIYEKDAYCLNVLCDLLCDGKKTPLYKAVVENEYAPDIVMTNNNRELAGELYIKTRTFPGTNLQEVYVSIMDAINNFDEAAIDTEGIERIKNIAETQYLNGLTSNMSIALNLAEANIFGGTPEMVFKELEMMRSVTIDDVIRVYRQYIKGRCHITTSFVPEGRQELTVAGATKAVIKEEKSEAQSAESEAGAIIDDEYAFSPSLFDRGIEPPLSILHEAKAPDIWSRKTENGINIKGIQDYTLPLIYFSLVIKGGAMADPKDKAGTAAITARLLKEGTIRRTPEELEDAIKSLGAEIISNARKEWSTISGICLAKNFSAIAYLIFEMITQPRWDEEEFQRIKCETVMNLQQSMTSPQKIANDRFYQVIFGNDNPIALPNEGTLSSVEGITLDDVKSYYHANYSPSVSDFVVTGAIAPEEVLQSLQTSSKGWAPFTPIEPVYDTSFIPPSKDITYIDFPNAKQAIIYVGRQALYRTHPDFYKANIVNYKLGESSGSDLFRVLRLEHGYTYGAYSFFGGNRNFGIFSAAASVQASVVEDALRLFKETIGSYAITFSEEDLAVTKTALRRKDAGRYETLEAKINMLSDIVTLGLPDNFVEIERHILNDFTYKETLEIISKHLNINDMYFVVLR